MAKRVRRGYRKAIATKDNSMPFLEGFDFSNWGVGVVEAIKNVGYSGD
jgi:hypothetical protein